MPLISYMDTCPSDTPTLDGLAEEIEELSAKLSSALQFIDDQFNATSCENSFLFC